MKKVLFLAIILVMSISISINCSGTAEASASDSKEAPKIAAPPAENDVTKVDCEKMVELDESEVIDSNKDKEIELENDDLNKEETVSEEDNEKAEEISYQNEELEKNNSNDILVEKAEKEEKIAGRVGKLKIENYSGENILIIPFYPYQDSEEKEVSKSIVMLMLNSDVIVGDITIALDRVIVMTIKNESNITYTHTTMKNIKNFNDNNISAGDFITSLKQSKGKVLAKLDIE